MQAWGVQVYFKKDSDTGVLLSGLLNFWEHFFVEHLEATTFE